MKALRQAWRSDGGNPGHSAPRSSRQSDHWCNCLSSANENDDSKLAHRVVKIHSGRVQYGKSPRHVGEVLLAKTAQPPVRRLSRDGMKELRRPMARDCERPRRHGEVLHIEAAQPSAQNIS